MKIIVKKVNERPEVKEIKGELHEMQQIVGGYIEEIKFYIVDNVLCVCDEEGKLKNKLINFWFEGDYVVGDVFFVAAGEENFESLSDIQIEQIMSIFK